MSYACVSAQPQWILNIPPYENHLTIQKVLCMSSNGLCLTTVVELISWGCVGGCCFNSANTTAGVSSSLHKTRVRLTRMGLIAGGHCSRRYQPAFKLPPPPRVASASLVLTAGLRARFARWLVVVCRWDQGVPVRRIKCLGNSTSCEF